MVFKKIESTLPAVNYLVTTLAGRLDKKQRLLWLLAGGSAINIEVEVTRQLKDNPNLNLLTISLADERFGPPGHNDSNLEQLFRAGFSLPGATIRPILAAKDFRHTLEDWQEGLAKDIKKADYVLAVAGIGADGHTFGIKPHSPALSSDQITAGYEWDDYIRLTITAMAIEQVDEIVVYAVGAEKKEPLTKLMTNTSPLEQPAQLLKQCRRVIIFNDQINQGE